MTCSESEPTWGGKRWIAMVAVLFVGQLFLILWFGASPRLPSIRTEAIPSFHVPRPDASNLLTLTDPTLFALPHTEVFSGIAWLTIPEQNLQPFSWSEPIRWLVLDTAELGEDFRRYAAANPSGDNPLISQPELKLMPVGNIVSPPVVTNSNIRVMGALSERPMLNTPSLRAWAAPDLLTNTVVQLLVGADGRIISGLLFKPGSGSAEADQFGLKEARKLRFAPLPSADPLDPMAGLTSGQIVFEWQTLRLETNTAAQPGTSN